MRDTGNKKILRTVQLSIANNNKIKCVSQLKLPLFGQLFILCNLTNLMITLYLLH